MLVVLAAILAGAAFLYFNPRYSSEWLERAVMSLAPETTVFYKWKDENGNWIATDEPVDGIPYERLEYGYDTNVLSVPPELQEKR